MGSRMGSGNSESKLSYAVSLGELGEVGIEGSVGYGFVSVAVCGCFGIRIGRASFERVYGFRATESRVGTDIWGSLHGMV